MVRRDDQQALLIQPERLQSSEEASQLLVRIADLPLVTFKQVAKQPAAPLVGELLNVRFMELPSRRQQVRGVREQVVKIDKHALSSKGVQRCEELLEPLQPRPHLLPWFAERPPRTSHRRQAHVRSRRENAGQIEIRDIPEQLKPARSDLSFRAVEAPRVAEVRVGLVGVNLITCRQKGQEVVGIGFIRSHVAPGKSPRKKDRDGARGVVGVGGGVAEPVALLGQSAEMREAFAVDSARLIQQDRQGQLVEHQKENRRMRLLNPTPRFGGSRSLHLTM